MPADRLPHEGVKLTERRSRVSAAWKKLDLKSSTYVLTKKESKSDNHFSKFDWHDLYQFFFGHNASSQPKSILETNKTSSASNSLIE